MQDECVSIATRWNSESDVNHVMQRSEPVLNITQDCAFNICSNVNKQRQTYDHAW